MKILILNGSDDPADGELDRYAATLAGRLEEEGHRVTSLTLRELDIRQCVGCFACWLKSPGLCVHRDDHHRMLRSFVECDLALAVSPLVMGFVTPVLKRTMDRIVPVLLPYIDGSGGECRHFLRYGRSPLLGLVYRPEGDTDLEDMEIVAGTWRRLARNAQSRLALFCPSSQSIEEVCHAIDRL